MLVRAVEEVGTELVGEQPPDAARGAPGQVRPAPGRSGHHVSLPGAGRTCQATTGAGRASGSGVALGRGRRRLGGSAAPAPADAAAAAVQAA